MPSPTTTSRPRHLKAVPDEKVMGLPLGKPFAAASAAAEPSPADAAEPSPAVAAAAQSASPAAAAAAAAAEQSVTAHSTESATELAEGADTADSLSDTAKAQSVLMAMSQVEDASEAAQVLASIVGDPKALPERVARELHRLLGHDLAVESTASLRWGHLRLLTHLIRTLVVEGDQEDVTSTQYDREVRRRRDELGEDWPDARDLTRQYGHWLKVYKAAADYWLYGGDARVPASWRHAEFRDGYQPEEVAHALIRCRRSLGRWPTEWEYERWAVIVRWTAARDPRLPVPKAIRKACGTFEAALEAARDKLGEQAAA